MCPSAIMACTQVFQEAEKLASLRHPCVMGFYGIVTEKGSVGTVAEYICHGSLRSGLSKIKKKVRRAWSKNSYASAVQPSSPAKFAADKQCDYIPSQQRSGASIYCKLAVASAATGRFLQADQV